MKVRTTREMDEDQARTIYVRLPHTIRDTDEIHNIFPGDIQVKLRRQSSRHCHVVFSSVEEKMKNLKAVKEVLINNKRIIAYSLKRNAEKLENTEKIKQKKGSRKALGPRPEYVLKFSRSLFIKNIPPKTKIQAIKAAFKSCKHASFLDHSGNSKGATRQAIVKLKDPKLAIEYLTDKTLAPVVNGQKLIIKRDTRKQKKKEVALKIFDGFENSKDNANDDDNNDNDEEDEFKNDDDESGTKEDVRT